MMAFREDRQDDGSFSNKAVQEKLEAWWDGLKTGDRKKLLGVAKAKGGTQRSWLDLPEDIRKTVFHAGMFMKRVTKGFPN